MKEQKETIMSYLVTIGFVIFILLFLSSLVFLSRLVLSQDSQFGTYVSSTQDLLKEIDRVQRDVQNVNISRNEAYINFPNGVLVEDISYITQRSSGKSFITFKLNRPTFIEGDVMYFEPENVDEISEGDLVLLNSSYKAYAISFEEESITFYVLEERIFIDGDLNDIKGVALYENRKENYNST